MSQPVPLSLLSAPFTTLPACAVCGEFLPEPVEPIGAVKCGKGHLVLSGPEEVLVDAVKSLERWLEGGEGRFLSALLKINISTWQAELSEIGIEYHGCGETMLEAIAAAVVCAGGEAVRL